MPGSRQPGDDRPAGVPKKDILPVLVFYHGGGWEPRWKSSGELFFRNGRRWFATRVSTDPEPRWNPPRLVFDSEFIDTPLAVAPRPQRYVYGLQSELTVRTVHAAAEQIPDAEVVEVLSRHVHTDDRPHRYSGTDSHAALTRPLATTRPAPSSAPSALFWRNATAISS